ncbi:insecticidal delta-endotoxin Cry8Ea1 family protein [Larkinella sp. GY13]|uniref:insecticidal delta-endotoxin Cry8Ea1 family protein n=1 Tax=Larkinella sp. GY13 TaxID=3453720 RepID=UPI003EEDE7EB
MSSQKLIHRRNFLERSMLGFGSAFLLPSLLQSCIKDHNFPTPQGPVGPVLDLDLDWNGIFRTAVTEGLSEIPEAGSLISALVEIIWPVAGESPWDQIKDQMKALIDKELADNAYKQVQSLLDGMRRDIIAYNQQVGTGADIKTFWMSLYLISLPGEDVCTQKENGYELLLLPLYVQYATMFLGILRDAVKYGRSWGMNDSEMDLYTGVLKQKIVDFTQHVDDTYAAGRAPFENKKVDMWQVEPFKSSNAFDRTMSMLVLDYRDTFRYYDCTIWPNGAKNPDGTQKRLFTREIYSDPHGNILGVGNNPVIPLVLPYPATELPTLLTVWSGDRIDAVQLAGYPGNGGPGLASATPRMGDTNGGTAHTFNLSPLNPITQVNINTYHSPATGNEMATDTLEFIFNDGTSTGMMGKTTGDSKLFSIGYAGYALSSIYVQGTSYWDPGKSINCIVFGFVPWPFHQ